MAGSSDIRAGGAFVELFTKDAALRKGLDAAAARLKAFGSTVQGIGAKMFGFGAAGLTGLGILSKGFADAGSAIADASARTGASAEALSQLGFAAKLSGSNLESVVGGMGKMQKTLAAAANGNKEATAAFDALGLSAAKLVNIDPGEAFQQIAGAVSDIGNPTQRAAAAMGIFGKGAAELLPMLSMGREEMAKLAAESDRLGITMSTADVEAADALGDAFDTLKAAIGGTRNAIGSSLAPVMTAVAKMFTEAVASVTRFVRENKGLVITALGVAGGLAAAGAAIFGLGTAFTAIGTVIGGVSAALGVVGTVVAAVATPIGLVAAALVAGAGAWAMYSDSGQAATAAISTAFGELKSEMGEAVGAIGNALANGNIAAAAQVLWLTLKLEWTKGINYLLGIWEEGKTGFIKIWNVAFAELVKLAQDPVSQLKKLWINIGSGLTMAFSTALAGIQSAWATFIGWIQKALVYIKSFYDSTVDVTEEFSKIDAKSMAAGVQGFQEAFDRNAAIEEGRQNRLNEVRKQQDPLLDVIDAQTAAANKAADERKAARLQALQDEVNAAKGLWQNAVNDAKNAVGAPVAAAKKKIGMPDFEATSTKAGSAGTFSAAALFGLGGGSIQTQQLAELKALRAQNIRDAERRRNEAAELARIIRTLKGEFA